MAVRVFVCVCGEHVLFFSLRCYWRISEAVAKVGVRVRGKMCQYPLLPARVV